MTAPAGFGRHRRHANPFTLRTIEKPPAMDDLFARPAPLALDIGCGMGSFLLDLAAAQPAWNVLGLEIRPHLVAGVNAAAAARELGNARALLANANVHLAQLLPPASLVQVSLNFPDPWFKRRHRKRRVLSSALLANLRPLLGPVAQLHVMTDVGPLAEEMRQVLLACPWLRCAHPEQRYALQTTTGVGSERERTHLGRGETVYRLLFVHNDAQTATVSPLRPPLRLCPTPQ